jgi:hypothetical protein
MSAQDDADVYPDTGMPDDGPERETTARKVVDDADVIFDKRKRWFLKDYHSHGQTKSREGSARGFRV